MEIPSWGKITWGKTTWGKTTRGLFLKNFICGEMAGCFKIYCSDFAMNFLATDSGMSWNTWEIMVIV